MGKVMHNCTGWRPDKPDKRDFKYSVPEHIAANLPTLVDLRPTCPAIFDQGQLGSCTANAISGSLGYEAIKNKQTDAGVVRSRLFIYWNERNIEGTVNTDAGAEIRDGIKVVASLGACDEQLWTYNEAEFAVKPNPNCFENAKKYEATQYFRVTQTLAGLKGCLAQGYPFVIGISVYDSFMTDDVASSGMIPMPGPNESVQGGHAIMIVGYDDAKQCFILRNSWGTSWGIAGYAYIPYAYLTDSNLADDCWTIRIAG